MFKWLIALITIRLVNNDFTYMDLENCEKILEIFSSVQY